MKSLVYLIILIGLFVVQYYLSMKKNKWLGLIVPTINILFSFLAIYTLSAILGKFTLSNSILQFLSMNITTVIFFGIYYSCRRKIRKDRNGAIDKMNIQDL